MASGQRQRRRWDRSRWYRVTGEMRSTCLDAPRDLVIGAGSIPKAIRPMWGPRGSPQRTHRDGDQAAGGKYTMHASDGTDYRTRFRYEEVRYTERIISIRPAAARNDDETHRIG